MRNHLELRALDVQLEQVDLAIEIARQVHGSDFDGRGSRRPLLSESGPVFPFHGPRRAAVGSPRGRFDHLNIMCAVALEIASKKRCKLRVRFERDDLCVRKLAFVVQDRVSDVRAAIENHGPISVSEEVVDTTKEDLIEERHQHARRRVLEIPAKRRRSTWSRLGSSGPITEALIFGQNLVFGDVTLRNERRSRSDVSGRRGSGQRSTSGVGASHSAYE